MDQLLEQARDFVEGTIVSEIGVYLSIEQTLTAKQDFKGQKLAEQISTYLLTIVGAIAFLAGYYTQDVYSTLYVGLAGTVITLLLVVPPWPFYNTKPERWLPARSGDAAYQGIQIEVDGKKIS